MPLPEAYKKLGMKPICPNAGDMMVMPEGTQANAMVAYTNIRRLMHAAQKLATGVNWCLIVKRRLQWMPTAMTHAVMPWMPTDRPRHVLGLRSVSDLSSSFHFLFGKLGNRRKAAAYAFSCCDFARWLLQVPVTAPGRRADLG